MPIASLLIIAANLIAAFLVVYDPDLAIHLGFDPKYPSFQGAVTSLFLHLNYLHLLGNMLFLAAVGAPVEIAAGSARFTIVYFLGGLAGVLAHLVFLRRMPDAPILIGASGAVAACAAYYTVRYSRLRVPIAPGLAAPVVVMTGAWLVLQIAGGVARIGDADAAVAYWAHIGGFAAGLILSMVFQAPKLADLELGHEVLREMNERSAGAVLAAAKVHLTSHPTDVAGLRQKADALSQLGDCDEEADTLLQLLERTPEPDQMNVIARLADINCLDRLPSLRRTMLADKMKATDAGTAVILLQSVVKGPREDPQRPDALLALVGLELDQQPERAKAHLEELFRDYPLHPASDLARARGWTC